MSVSTLPMLDAAYKAVEAVRTNHPDIPEVLVVLGAPGKTKKSQIHGHFAPRAWASDMERIHELLLSGESLQRGGKATMGTIIHELAHAYCNAKGVQDTSNAGRYHNARFREVAEDFGLTIEKAPTIGCSVTTVPNATALRYQPQIEALDQALTAYRDHSQIAASKTAKKFLMQCPTCKDPSPIGKRWFERNVVMCRVHDVRMQLLEEETTP